MSQKSSLPQVTRFVSGALMPDTRWNACRSGSTGSSSRPMSSTSCPISSSSGVCRSIYGPTMARSSSRMPSRTGSPPSAPERPTSLRGAHGRTATSRVSTPASGTNCSMARSSTRSPRPASSWKAGAASTTHCALMDHWATGLQPRRFSFRSPRGRLRHTNRLRRPRWRRSRHCTNIF